MVRGSFLIVVLLALGSACSGLGSFEVYCRNSGACACVDGACCAFEGKSCEDLECCDGAACISGVCGTPVRFELTPSSIDFGEVRSLPSAPQPVKVTNTSMDAAALEFWVDGGYALAGSDCPDRLAAGASCTVLVRVVGPDIRAELRGTLQVENARPRSVSLLAATGRKVSVVVSGPMSVTSTPPGISCPDKCEATYPFDVRVSLIPSEVPYGYSVDSVHLWCDVTTGTCPVFDSAQVEFVARPNLIVQCIGDGSVWVGDERVCLTEGVVGYGGKAMVGTAHAEARPDGPNGSIYWYADCEGVTGNVCTREITGRTTMIVRFY